MSFDLTSQSISTTFQNLLQKTGSGNQLYDLQGNQIVDLTIAGALHAQSYIVSQSTTVATSGSTIFGDSHDDTHTFIGSLNHITASGGISASGDVYFRQDVFIGEGAHQRKLKSTSTSGLQILHPSTGNQYAYFGNYKTKFGGYAIGGDPVVEIDEDASLTIGTGDYQTGTRQPPEKLTVKGNISASGDIYSSEAYLDNYVNFYYGTADYHSIKMQSPAVGQRPGFAFLSGSTTLMQISHSRGNAYVGIGTKTPQKTLTVEGSISASGLYLKNANYIYGDGRTILGSFDDETYVGSTEVATNILGTEIQMLPAIKTDITQEGHFTTTGNISSSGNLFLKTGQRITWGDNTGPDYRIRGHAAGLQLLSGSNVNHILHDQNTGNVAFGTDTVSDTKLTVEGDISASGFINLGTGTYGGIRFSSGSGGTVRRAVEYYDNLDVLQIGGSGQANEVRIFHPGTITNFQSNGITTTGDISGSSTSTGSFGNLNIGGAGDASLFVDGNISASGTIIGSIVQVPIRTDDFAIWQSLVDQNKWVSSAYPALSVYGSVTNTLDDTSPTDTVKSVLYTAPSDMSVNKIRWTWYWTDGSLSGDEDFEFVLAKSTPTPGSGNSSWDIIHSCNASSSTVGEAELASSVLTYSGSAQRDISAGDILTFLVRVTSGNPNKASIYGSGDIELIRNEIG